jgi:xanthine dehydrogenase accessory factor
VKVLIRGSGDVASAVAHRLFALGHSVLIHEVSQPAYTRRGMAFTDAVFDGKADLQGVWAKCPHSREELQHMLACGRAIPVFTGALDEALVLMHPDVLVDARMRKRSIPEGQIGLAPLSIGLGPNFTAGVNVDVAIETAWGESLGRILHIGATLPLEGEPREIGGLGRERCVYATEAGVLQALVSIGDWVEAGDQVALLNGQTVCAPVSGHVRGICHAEVPVTAGSKILEIDPRQENASLFGLGERPLRIAEAVVRALGGQ